ncbi:hypothetical protein PFICI_07897 [Pestalotiopsis fici W106-1]|uniref:Ubiquitin-like domain-containing protein n=1 Tax=Pestalotiopsis fici (strain W106-1 / CGMCC3.15140) TaxID=1229662 RepID=W3X2J9_PESFW|nr:uncharacterized protein PFICI_07897 [Pestalotiopsis fici W106-1]ETS80368.1 hypothetical protein PFICI_07897 [Pestalotiopsis fici W106-1]
MSSSVRMRTSRSHSRTRPKTAQHAEVSGESSGVSEEGGDSRELYDEDDENWSDEEGDVEPSDSASSGRGPSYRRPTGAGGPVRRAASGHRHPATQHPPPSGYAYRQGLPQVQPPHHPSDTASLDSSEDYPYGFGNQYPPQGGYGGGRSRGGPGYQHGGYGGPYAPFPSQQVVPFGNNYGNPFAPAGGGGNQFFGNDHRWGGGEVMPYGGSGAGYFNGPHGGGHYPVPLGMQQYAGHWASPPPVTDLGARPKPEPSPAPAKDDPEKLEMMKQLEAIKAEKAKREAEEQKKEFEARIREETERAFKQKMEERDKQEELLNKERAAAAEKAKKEIEEARQAAEKATRDLMEKERQAAEERKKEEAAAIARAQQAARDQIEAERRAEEKQKKMEAEAVARAQQAARDQIEAERKADEERRKRETELAAAAEAAAKAKLEAAIKAKEEAEAAAKKKMDEEAEWRKLLETEAKLKAENEAREKIEKERKDAEDAKAAEEAKKKEEEAWKKKTLAEVQAKAEEASRKSKGKDKSPIRFKDAVGRKFSFPFHLCQTWTGMEELIKQAFLHVDVIGPHVQAGHYDLLGPDQEIILPQVWDKVIEPDWAITMVMWPMDRGRPAGLGGHPHPHPHAHGVPGHPNVRPPGMQQGGIRATPGISRMPGGPTHGGPPVPPPQPMHPAFANMHSRGGRPQRMTEPSIIAVHPDKPKKKSKSSSGLGGFLFGRPQPKKSSKKKAI